MPQIWIQAQPYNLAETMAQAEQIKGLRSRNAMADLEMDRYRRGVEQENQLAKIYASGADLNDPDVIRRVMATSPSAGLGLMKMQGEARKNSAIAGQHEAASRRLELESALKKTDLGSRMLSGVRDEPSYQRARTAAPSIGLDTSQWPERYDPAWTEETRRRGLGLKDEIEMQLRQADTQSRIAHRGVMSGYYGSIMGKPQVITTPGGVYTAPRGSTEFSRIEDIPSQIETEGAREEIKQRVRNEQKYRDFAAKVDALTNAADVLRADLEQHGTQTDYGVYASPEAGVQGTRYADVIAGQQQIREMGVLQPGEFPFLEMAVGNPTRPLGVLKGPAIKAQLSEVRAQGERAKARARKRLLQDEGTPALSAERKWRAVD